MSETTGIRGLDDVVLRLVGVAEREEARRASSRLRRRPPWLRDVPAFAIAALVAGALIAGLIALVSGSGTEEPPPPPAGDETTLGPGDWWYVRQESKQAGEDAVDVSETWMRADGAGRIYSVRRGGEPSVPFESEHGPTDAGTVGGQNAPPPVEPEFGPGDRLTYDEIGRLPTDRKRLLPILREAVHGTNGQDWILLAASLLGGPLPVPYELRREIIAIVATRPDVRTSSSARDSHEEGPVALTADVGRSQIRLIVDKSRTQMIGMDVHARSSGRLRSTMTIVERGIVRSNRERLGAPAVPAALYDNFEIFRRPQRPPDIPPPDARDFGVDPARLDFRTARFATEDEQGNLLYVVAGRDIVCLTHAGCTPIPQAAGGGLVAGWRGCSPAQLFALLPDRVRDIETTTLDRRPLPRVIRDNRVNVALGETRAGKPASILWTTIPGVKGMRVDLKPGCP